MAPLLELRSITMDFPGVRALNGVSLTLEKGEVHALCGENGAGKSTLIKILCGYYPAPQYGGSVVLEGQPVAFRRLREAEEHGIALIAQELALVPHLSVAENMVLGREPIRRGCIQWKAVMDDAMRGLERVGLDIDPDTPVQELGIGQQQMVEIAKALAKKARILVLDEPTAALTEKDSKTLLHLVSDLAARGVACIYVSHRLAEVFRIASRITVLRDGESKATRAVAEWTEESVITSMVGREVKDLYPRIPGPSEQASVALRVEDWSVPHPDRAGVDAVREVQFSVQEGEILGIAGLMGAGRTALLSSLFGAGLRGARGNLWVKGRAGKAPMRSPQEAIASGLALVSEDRKRYGLVLEASLLENMTLVALARFCRHGVLNEPARAEAAKAIFESLHIRAPHQGNGLEAPANQLSGGNQQKIVLGKWLMANPRVLLLDEPTRGIDVGAKAEIYAIVNRLAAEGLAVLLVSSDLPELLGLSHRIIVLNQGRQTASFEQSLATPERVMAAATRKVA